MANDASLHNYISKAYNFEGLCIVRNNTTEHNTRHNICEHFLERWAELSDLPEHVATV